MKIENINNKFRALTQWNLKHRALVLFAFVAVLGLSVMGLKKIYFETSWDSYFVADDPMLLKTDEFKSIFGNDYYVAVLVQNKDGLLNKKSLELIRELSNDLMKNLSYSEKITSLTDLEFMVGTEDGMELSQIVPDTIPGDEAGLNLIKERAYSKPNLAKKLVSKDGTMSWILVKLRPFPADSIWKAETNVSPDMMTGGEAHNICMQEKYKDLNPNISGMPYMTYSKMQYLGGQMKMLMMIAVIVGLIIMTLVTRSLRGVLTPIFTTIFGILMAFGWVGWFGLYIDQSATMSVVILCFAIAIAYNIHFYNFFRTQMVTYNDRKRAVIDAVAETGWPILFSGITTLAAMLTFVAMHIVPMRAIGINSALCIVSVLITCLIITPVIFSLGKNSNKNAKATNKTFEGRAGNAFDKFGLYVLNHSKAIITIVIAVALFCSAAVYRIEPAFDVERSMGRLVPYVNDFLDLCETELGSMYSYDLMIVLPNADEAKDPENLKKLEQLETEVESYKHTKRHASVLDIIKDMNCTLNGNNPDFYVVPENSDMVAQLLLLYENAGGSESEYWMDYDYQRLRLQIEIGTYNSKDAEIEINALQNKARELFPNAEVSAVGNLPQFTVMQQYLVRGQMWSLVLSVVIVGILLMLVFGKIKLGLVGMIPNIAPVVFVGGMMGWLNYPLDMMTACCIPMVLGIAVDDTIHFVNHAHLEFDRKRNYRYAVRRTFRVIGLAIVMSTVIIAATFMGFTASKCNQFFNFGILAVAGMLSALAADLFITPLLFKYFKVFGEETVSDEEIKKTIGQY